MARQVGVDLDFSRVAQILNARLQNVTTTERTTLAGTLGGANIGLFVYDTTEKQIYIWDGSAFQPTKVQGALVYKGTATSLTTAPVGYQIGSTYVFTGTAGMLTWAGQTFSPDPDIEVGDILIYRGGDIWDIIEGNDAVASVQATALKVDGGASNTSFPDYLLRLDFGANGSTINPSGTP